MHRPGRKPALTDAELVCLTVGQQLLGVAVSGTGNARLNPAGMFP